MEDPKVTPPVQVEKDIVIQLKPEGENTEQKKGRLKEYTVKVAEKHLVHVEHESMSFKKGTKTSKPFVQMYETRTWLNQRKELTRMGYDYNRVLHAPEGVDKTISPKPKNEDAKNKKA